MAANEELYDAILQHSVNLQRLTQGEMQNILGELRKADAELNVRIAQRMEKTGGVVDFTTERWQKVVGEIRRMRSSLIQSVGSQMGGLSDEIVQSTINATMSALTSAVPVEINFAAPGVATVQELARETPFGGADMAADLAQWFVDLQEADLRRISGAVKAGMVQGETMPDIINRVMKAQELTRQNADAIGRTMVNHASNMARTEVFVENAAVIQALKVVATLDGRTSPICRARDGHYDALIPGGDMTNVPYPHIEGSPRRAPFHPRCRTVMVAQLDPEGIDAEMGERPFVTDKRGRRMREKDFRAEAKAAIGADEWSKLSLDERNALIRERRQAWTADNVGTVPGDTTYDSWLRKQPKAFQDDVLGPTRGDLFRNGLSMDQYVDLQGRQLSVAAMKERYPEYFAGKVDKPTTAELARKQELERLRTVKAAESEIVSEQAAIARQNELDERELWDPELDKKRANADQHVREDLKTTGTPTESDWEFQLKRQLEVDARREAYITRNRDALQADIDLRIEAAIKAGGPLPYYPLEDDKFLRALAPAQQDMLLGPAAADLLRSGVPSRLLVKWPDDGGPPRPRAEFELLDRHASAARTMGTGWTRAQQEAWNRRMTVDDLDAIRTWTGQDAALSTIQNPGTSRPQIGYKNLDQPGKYQPRYTPEVALEHLNEALSTMPVYDGELYRGIGMWPEDLQALLATGEFELPHHSSSSTMGEVANAFAGAGQSKMQRYAGRSDGQRVVFCIQKQHNGRMIMDHALDGEYEALLMKGTKYRILSYERSPNGAYYLNVEEIS